jgi:hypothetical protein
MRAGAEAAGGNNLEVPVMRTLALPALLALSVAALAADIESRALTHYIPQDLLEAAVRKEGWTEIVLQPFGGVRKGDIARIWAGGVIDCGGDQPGTEVVGPSGPARKGAATPGMPFALASDPDLAYALLFKTDDGISHKCNVPGKPLEILLREGGKLWVGFNDERGAFRDNHLGKGQRHELDPLWVRVEVIRIVVD